MSIADYARGRILGEGAYGHIVYGTVKTTGDEVAIKCITKSRVARAKKLNSPKIEQLCLERCSSVPAVVGLRAAFQDSLQVFLVLEYLPNGTLADFMKSPQPVERIRSAFSEILIALADVHRLGIIHRDVKPENLLFDSAGKLKIIDFGSAKIFDAEAPFARGSFVGTVDYIPPEVLSQRPQTPAMDLWAFGCMLFRAFCEQPPFYAATKMETYANIESMKFTIPGEVAAEAADLISRLLVREAENRIGYGEHHTYYPAIRGHPFFAEIDWGTLMPG
jgi:serine/threonine protein kinase